MHVCMYMYECTCISLSQYSLSLLIYLYKLYLFIDINNDRGIAMRKIGEAIKVCKNPDFTCLKHLSTVREGADIDCVVAINKELALLVTREKRKEYFLNIVKQSIGGYSNKHYVKPNWMIGPQQLGIKGCCRGCLCHYYEICDATLTNYCTLVKKGFDSLVCREIGDKSIVYEYTSEFRNAISRLTRDGIEINHTMMAAMQIPNSTAVSLLLMLKACMFICL